MTMKRIGWSSLALMLLLAIGLVPALDARAQSRTSETSAAAQDAATVEIITYNCATEPLLDGSLATTMPEGCSDKVWIYSGTIVDSSGIIVTSHMAAFADPGESDKLGWQIIGFKQEGEETPLFAVVAQPIALDEALGIAMLYPILTIDGDPIEEGDLNLPTVRLADQGEVAEGTEITFTGWASGETAEDDRLNSVESAIQKIFADEILKEIGEKAWLFSPDAVCCSMMGAGAFTDEGRLIGTVTNAASDEEGTWARPMPEAIMVLNGEDLSSGETPVEDPVETPEDKPRQPKAQEEGTSTLVGTVVSADTGEPIPGAVVLIIQPGVTVDEALSSEDSGVVYGGAETDGNGKFRIDRPVVKGEKYGIIAIAEGYNVIGGDGLELAPADAGDTVDLGVIKLSTQQ
jgi:hypothetical protein